MAGLDIFGDMNFTIFLGEFASIQCESNRFHRFYLTREGETDTVRQTETS